MSDDALKLENICKKLILFGTPDEVADKILAFREEVGEFGTLLYAGHDWKDVNLAKNSMNLMTEKVMPQINNNINIAAE
jgi:alkanesulfonate monooxygenase SsuD/methylene tetrahydromethanopterin reductase-like flavin-dependent oxidoreductase (luciferase family)